MTKANYKYKNSSGEPTLTELVRIRIESLGKDAEFSIADFRDIPTNISSALKKLEAMEEIVLLERRKVEGERFSRNFYQISSLYQQHERGKEGEEAYSFQGWERVYPEFFTIPSFPIINITRVGERI